jgi:nicotinate-nucleotide adenylyltransferase
MMRHSRVDVTDIEARLGTRYTAETLQALQQRYPGLRFVWLMGADNLAQFHRWQRWRQIAVSVPLGVLARPGDRISARMSPTARVLAKARLAPSASHLLGRADPPAWCFVNVPLVAQSSTEIRAKGDWSA